MGIPDWLMPADMREGRLVKAMPLSQIASVPEGALAKIGGHIKLPSRGAVVSPLSGIRCACYRIVELQTIDGPFCFSSDFFLDDGSAAAWVRFEDQHVYMDPRPGKGFKFGKDDPRTPAQQAFLDEAMQRQRFATIMAPTFSERLLAENAAVLAVGIGRWVPTPEVAREVLPGRDRVLQLDSVDKTPVIVDGTAENVAEAGVR